MPTGERIWPCECLDLVEAAHRRRIDPLMYCRMELAGHLDIRRLKQSVALSGRAVPEILCAYDFKRGCFADVGYTADDAVTYAEAPSALWLRQDPGSSPQLQILIIPEAERERVLIRMSHILADGRGFLQYLYLLAALYNGGRPEVRNTRALSPLPERVPASAPAEQRGHGSRRAAPLLHPEEKGGRLFCLTSRIAAEDLALIRQRVKRQGATLNDAFMAAYARVAARLQNTGAVVLSCPADLRRFLPDPPALTVANMTGMYRRVVVESPADRPFAPVLRQVHAEMERQKAQRRCLEGIGTLNTAFRRLPRPLLEQAIKAAYRPPPAAYTNLGAVDHKRLFFRGCAVRECFFTGAYRLPPDFQLTVSTFQNRCTLNCTLAGTGETAGTCRNILEQVKRELLKPE